MTTVNSCGEPYQVTGASTIFLGVTSAASGATLTMSPTGTGFTTIPSWTSTYNIPGIPTAAEFRDVLDRMERIENRLAILIPNDDLQKRFPALQEAYDAYKMIEKLVQDPNKSDKNV